ncbi:MAG TPA: toll/interleukin-1 receptor domain-containing protein [Anaerolineales bacterium]|nr:toll/interleukin-1 receptor domain-containing protein [Anaerolineales bacterium]
MQPAWRIDPNALIPFNDAPNYLVGEVTADEFDNLLIRGSAKDHMQGWHNIGAGSVWLEPESFEILVSTISFKELGACSTRIIDDNGLTRIALSHFVRSSLDLRNKKFVENFYSGFGFDERGERSQLGIPAEWDAMGRHHNVMLQYDHDDGVLSCYANNLLVHWILGRLGRFKLQVLVQAVGVEGDFDFRFERLMYRPTSKSVNNNINVLNCWLPEYSPTFVSYSHADKQALDGVKTWLRSRGVRLMGDWNFLGGDSLLDKISTYISRASFLIVGLSPTSVKSNWVSKELKLALSRQLADDKQIRIVPILLAPCEVPPFLQDMVRFDLTTADTTEQLNKLLETLSFRQRW